MVGLLTNSEVMKVLYDRGADGQRPGNKALAVEKMVRFVHIVLFCLHGLVHVMILTIHCRHTTTYQNIHRGFVAPRPWQSSCNCCRWGCVFMQCCNNLPSRVFVAVFGD